MYKLFEPSLSQAESYNDKARLLYRTNYVFELKLKSLSSKAHLIKLELITSSVLYSPGINWWIECWVS